MANIKIWRFTFESGFPAANEKVRRSITKVVMAQFGFESR